MASRDWKARRKRQRPAVAAMREQVIRKWGAYDARGANLAALGFTSYRDYLASDLWRSIRTALLRRDGSQCRFCPAHAIQVHHENYSLDVLAGRSLHKLYSTCEGCHRRLEFTAAGTRRTPIQVAKVTRAAARREKRRREDEVLDEAAALLVAAGVAG